MIRFTRHQLSTGVTLNVGEAGQADGPAILFLHGFPESHRTWRGLVPLLEDRYRLIMPDQRGFAGSDAPQDPKDYATDKLVGDLFALVDRLGLDGLDRAVERRSSTRRERRAGSSDLGG